MGWRRGSGGLGGLDRYGCLGGEWTRESGGG